VSRFRWITARFKGRADAQKVGEALEAIERRDGDLSPAAIVEAARDPRSPLHPCFTWADDAAAEKHRETEARAVVRSCRIVVRIKGGGKKTRRKWISVRIDTGEERPRRGYVSITKVRSGELADEIMAEAAQGLRQWAGRYSELRGRLPGLFQAIDEVLAEYTKAA